MLPSAQAGSARRSRTVRGPAQADRCQLCSATLGERHEHLYTAVSGALRCACGGCARAFAGPGGRFLRVAPCVRALAEDLIDDAQWAALGLPLGLCWLSTRRRDGQVIACLPGPAGPSYAQPEADAWTELCAARPEIAAIPPDTEALLVRRVESVREHWQVSIDECHRLVALMRSSPFLLDDFFAGLRRVAS